MSNFKTKFCWWPVRLARHVPIEGTVPPTTRMEFIGWVWLQEATLTKNINHGWVAFLDSKLLPKKCRKCGQELPNKTGGGVYGDI
jgi:hypothetical protein